MPATNGAGITAHGKRDRASRPVIFFRFSKSFFLFFQQRFPSFHNAWHIIEITAFFSGIYRQYPVLYLLKIRENQKFFLFLLYRLRIMNKKGG